MKKLLCLLVVTSIFASCKKEEIKTSSTKHIGSTENTSEFSRAVKVYEKNNPDSYVLIEMTSANEKLLVKTSEELQNSFIELIEGTPDDESQSQENAPQISTPDSVGIFYNLDWNNFKFKEKQNKMFGISIQNKNNISKAMTYVTTLSNLSGFSSSAGYCIVGVQNTYSWWALSCFCTKYKTSWHFHNQIDYNGLEKMYTISGQNDYLEYRVYDENMFQTYLNHNDYGHGKVDGSTPPFYSTDYVNRIKSARGIDYDRGGNTPATVSFWVMN